MKKISLALVIAFGLTQITKAQMTTCLPCDQLGISVNVGSDTNMVKLYHSGQYLTHPQSYNIFVWEITDMQGNIISHDTVVDSSDYYIFHNTPLIDTMNVTVYLRNNSAILPDGNIVNCLFEDQLYWKIDTFPVSGTLYGAWTFIHNNVGVDQNVISAVNDIPYNKELIKITDILGRESKQLKNKPLFYIYDDGKIEKKIIFE